MAKKTKKKKFNLVRYWQITARIILLLYGYHIITTTQEALGYMLFLIGLLALYD